MGLIKAKEGVCVCCKRKRLIYSRKMCQDCYWIDNAKKNNEKKKTNGKTAEKVKTAKEMNLFFASQAPEIPNDCENCGGSLKWQKQNRFKSIIAHILPKRKDYGFPSVATHPKNRMFLCSECHANMDNKGKEWVQQMNCFPLMIERLKEFVHLVKEKRQLPNDFDKFV